MSICPQLWRVTPLLAPPASLAPSTRKPCLVMETPIGSAPVREPTLSAAAELFPRLHLTARRPPPARFG